MMFAEQKFIERFRKGEIDAGKNNLKQSITVYGFKYSFVIIIIIRRRRIFK